MGPASEGRRARCRISGRTRSPAQRPSHSRGTGAAAGVHSVDRRRSPRSSRHGSPGRSPSLVILPGPGPARAHPVTRASRDRITSPSRWTHTRGADRGRRRQSVIQVRRIVMPSQTWRAPAFREGTEIDPWRSSPRVCLVETDLALGPGRSSSGDSEGLPNGSDEVMAKDRTRPAGLKRPAGGYGVNVNGAEATGAAMSRVSGIVIAANTAD